jgi:Ca2+:H+ antiporter
MRRHGAELQAQACCWYARPFMPRSQVRLFFWSLALRLTFVCLEILVEVVDVVLEGSGIDEKFLGITLFALVPNTTEFMNAMSFALNGNIALRYVVYVSNTTFGHPQLLEAWKSALHTHCKSVCCKFQPWLPSPLGMRQRRWEWYPIPSRGPICPSPICRYADQKCSLIFPRWDVLCIILAVFLMTYTYIEAKSNYHRGSILILR